MGKLSDQFRWRAFQRKRDAFEVDITKRWEQALKKQIKPVSEYLARRQLLDFQQAINEALDKITESPVQQVMDYTYGKVGGFFSVDQLRQMQKAGLMRVQQADENLWFQYMQRFSQDHAAERVTSITNTTKDQAEKVMRQQLAAGIEAGDGSEVIARNIRVGLNSEMGRIAQWRARMIARTEIVTASNAGSLSGALSTGLDFQKVWLATSDNRTRESHYHMNGKKVPKQAQFTLNGYHAEYPGDMNLPADEVINCRCTIIYDFGDEPDKKPDKTEDITGFKPALTIKEAEEFARDEFGIKRVIYNGINDLDTVNKINEEMYNLLQDYSVPHLNRFGTGRMSSSTYAHANSTLLEVNPHWFGDIQKATKQFAKDCRSGWHPRSVTDPVSIVTHEFGHVLSFNDIRLKTEFAKTITKIKARYTRELNKITRELRKNNEYVAKLQEQIVTLEEDLYKLSYQERKPIYREIKRLQEEIKSFIDTQTESIFISDYAAKNADEFVAESFALYRHAPGTNKYADEVGKLIDKHFKKKSK